MTESKKGKSDVLSILAWTTLGDGENHSKISIASLHNGVADRDTSKTVEKLSQNLSYIQGNNKLFFLPANVAVTEFK